MLLTMQSAAASTSHAFAIEEAKAPRLFSALLPQRLAYAERSSQQVSIKIMPLGDSITFGNPDITYGGYRHLLGTLLTNDGYIFDFVGSRQSGNGLIPDPDNEGHPDWTVRQIRNGIDSNGWLERYHPDIILLHMGTNDLRRGGAAAAPGSLSALLDDILARLPRVHVIVAQIIAFRHDPERLCESYNNAVAAMVASKGARVSTVDMRNILSASDYADEVHPNAAGYDKMARSWEAAIRKVISSRPHAAAQSPPGT